MKPADIDDLLHLLRNKQNFLILGHYNPDPDCIASQWGLAEFLKRKGKTVMLANAGPLKEKIFSDFRDHFKESLTEELPLLNAQETVLIAVDCSSPDRLGTLQNDVSGFFTVVIDHHANGDPSFGDLRFINPKAPSTTILIKQLICAWDAQMLPAVAEILFWGFCTDSGFFRFLQNDSAPYIHDAADLVSAGAVPSRTYAKMMYGKSLQSRVFVADMIKKMKRFYGNRFFMAVITKNAGKKYGEEKDTAAFYEMVTAVEGCEMIALIKYTGFRSYIVSLRSVRIDVGQLALSFGGGGHKLASGFRYHGSLRFLKRRLIREAGILLKK